jgi:3-methyladenine DNA glycosylase AlkC
MYALTKRFSCEFAIRPYIIRYPELVFERLRRWLTDPDVHVRRLVSEGTRPRLPWGERLRALDEDPTPSLPLLDALRDDAELFVRRSVANHIGDIAKRHPELAVEHCAGWLNSDDSEESTWVVKHALRTLVKRGHAGALALQGFEPPLIEVESFTLSETSVDAGGSFELALQVRSTSAKPQLLAIDYALHLLKNNGSHAPSVFKWSIVTLKPGEARTLTKRHVMRIVSTRRFYDGEQRVSVQINGQAATEQLPFSLHV